MASPALALWPTASLRGVVSKGKPQEYNWEEGGIFKLRMKKEEKKKNHKSICECGLLLLLATTIYHLLLPVVDMGGSNFFFFFFRVAPAAYGSS